MNEKELNEAINKLLTENGYELRVNTSPAHNPIYSILDPLVINLVKSTLKFEIVLTPKENALPRP